MNSNRFIANFWNATTILGPWEYENPDADKNELDEFALKSARLWCRTATVEGMDPASFKKLKDEERQELVELRQKFLDACQVTTDQRAATLAARNALVRMYDLIGKYVTSLETITVAKALTEIIRDQNYFGWFRGFSMEFGSGWNGDPVIRVVLILDDTLANDARFMREYTHVHQRIHEELREKGVLDHVVVMSVRPVHEQELQLQQVAA